MKISIPSLADPAAKIMISTASRGPFALELVDSPAGITKRVVAHGVQGSGLHVVSSEIPSGQVARFLFDGFEVSKETGSDLAGEIVNALVGADLARIVAK